MMKNELLRRAREERGWTQVQLAQKLGVGVRTVRSWENGERSPYPKHHPPLCNLFGLTAAELGLEPDGTEPLPPEQAPTVSTRAQQDPNRHRMLNRVRSTWITGVLDLSLLQGAFIHLRLQEQPDAVVNPWSQVVQQTNRPPRLLSEQTRLRDVYDEADGSLLILGEPGAGKTTLLLSLARDLLDQACLDHSLPIPVVFHLATFAQKPQTLSDWIIDELNLKYQVPRKLGKLWVAKDQVLPLLDGLDEVPLSSRNACIDAINAYREAHSFVPLVVCSRASGYLTQPSRLGLDKALVLQPLTPLQIQQYLSAFGGNTTAIRDALQTDAILQEMTQTPLMLNILVLTFQDLPIQSILLEEDPTKRRRTIFQKYVEVVLRRGPKTPRYSSEQTIHWLAWLAKKMQEHNQSEFYIERMQPDWLNTHTRQKYHLTVYRVLFGLSTLVNAGLFALFRGDSFPDQPGLFYWLGGGKGSSILGWMQAGLGPYLKGALSMTFIFAIVSVLIGIFAETRVFIPTGRALQQATWNSLRYGSTVGIGCGIFALFVFSHTLRWDMALSRGITLAVLIGFIVTLLAGLGTILKFGRSTRAPKQDFTKSAHPLLERSVDFLFFSACGAIGFTSLYALQSGTLFNHVVLTNASITSFYFGLVFLIAHQTDLFQIDPEVKPAETVAWSWQNVRADLASNIKKGIVLGVIILIIFTGASTSVSTFFYGIHYGLPYGIVFGAITAFITGCTSLLTSVLIGGWESSVLADKQQFIHPNEGIRRSIYHALFAASLFGPLGGLASGLMSGVAFGLAGVAGWVPLGTGFSIIFSVLLALHFFINYGGRAVVSHYILRWYFWRSQFLPLNIVHFLDSATDRILLRKVGGGYIFAHRLLLEYFASLE